MNQRIDRATTGARLRLARISVGLTQTDVAVALGTTPSQVSRWEAGERLILPDFAAAFGRIYGFDLNFIYSGNEAGLSADLRRALAAARRRGA